MSNTKTYQPHTSSLGNMNAGTVVLLCCLALIIFDFWGFVFSCVVIAIERKSGLVKFGAAQAALVWAVFAVVTGVLAIVNGTFTFFTNWFFNYSGGFLGPVIGLLNAACTVILIWLAVKGNRWQEVHIPVVANIAEIISRTGAPVLYNGEGPVPPECQVVHTGSHNPGQQPPPYNNNNGQPYQQPPQGSPYQQQPSQNTYSTDTSASGPAQSSPHDPNSQLPPEMRDEPAPKDMR